jgi:hypothetical protein
VITIPIAALGCGISFAADWIDDKADEWGGSQ